MDTFARWLLGFAGAAIPVEPSEAVDAIRGLVLRTRALYEKDVTSSPGALPWHR